MDKEKVFDIEELVQDSHNFNKGTEGGAKLMERSLKELGAGRSILIDKNGNIIAGNKTQEAAIKAGIKKVRVIETTGDELVAVKRTDVDINSAEGRKMAFIDNLATQVNLTWDETELKSVQDDVAGFDIADFGFDIADLPQVTFPTSTQGDGSQQKDPTNSELDVDGFGDKIKLVLNFNEAPILFKEIKDASGEPITGEMTLLAWKNRKPSDKNIGDTNVRVLGKSSNFNTCYAKDNQVLGTLTASAQMVLYSDPVKMSTSEMLKAATFPIDYNAPDAKVLFLTGMSVAPLMSAQISYQIYKQWLSKINK